jgi:hypothetical protein
MPDEINLTDEDLDQIAGDLEDANQLWEKVAYLSSPKMPCPECGGSGQVFGGSLGDVCPGCMGMRVLDHPGADLMDIPDFAGMRLALGAYCDAKRDGRALPPASTVPTREQIAELAKQAKAKAETLPSAPLPAGIAAGQLAEPKKATGMLGDGNLGDVSDDELDEIEAEEAEIRKREEGK